MRQQILWDITYMVRNVSTGERMEMKLISLNSTLVGVVLLRMQEIICLFRIKAIRICSIILRKVRLGLWVLVKT